MKESIKGAIILSLLSPFFAEVLSGSTPPSEAIANPLSFPLLWAYYGSGVILLRELWVRKNPTPMGLMLIGFSYGIMEEGLFIKSWFDPHWMDLGILGTYGRIWGINTVWATWLTIFHGFMSVWVPITVFNLIYPNLAKEKLIGKRGTLLLLVIFTLMAILMFFGLNPYMPPLPQYSLAALLAVITLYFSTKFKLSPLGEKRLSALTKRPFVLGLLYSIAMFIIFVFIPYTDIPFPVPIVLGIPLAILFFQVQVGKKERYVQRILLGSLSFWLLFYDFALFTMGYPLELAFGVITYGTLFYIYSKRFCIGWKECMRSER